MFAMARFLVVVGAQLEGSKTV